MAKDNFDRISRQIKKEVEMFDVRKANDFKRSIVKYLEYMLKAQEKMTAQWERYLPEVQQISIWKKLTEVTENELWTVKRYASRFQLVPTDLKKVAILKISIKVT